MNLSNTLGMNGDPPQAGKAMGTAGERALQKHGDRSWWAVDMECGGHRLRRESAEAVPPLSDGHGIKEKAAAKSSSLCSEDL
jgi:hypothetical protein